MASTYKTLGQTDPTATTLTDIYTVPSVTSAIVEGIIICNRSATPTTVRVAVSVGGGAIANKDYVIFDMALAGNQTITFNGVITMATTDKLRVYATLATVSFNAFGVEIT